MNRTTRILVKAAIAAIGVYLTFWVLRLLELQ